LLTTSAAGGVAAAAVVAFVLALQASGTGGSVIMGASNSADIVTAITKGLSNMLFNIQPTVLPGCPANITFTPEVVTSVGVARVSP
jgi:hypothetical protein